MSQKMRILDFLKKHPVINDYICFNSLRITDLQHYIYELRNEGYIIKDEWVYCTTIEGEKRKYKNYWMEK